MQDRQEHYVWKRQTWTAAMCPSCLISQSNLQVFRRLSPRFTVRSKLIYGTKHKFRYRMVRSHSITSSQCLGNRFYSGYLQISWGQILCPVSLSTDLLFFPLQSDHEGCEQNKNCKGLDWTNPSTRGGVTKEMKQLWTGVKRNIKPLFTLGSVWYKC